jgi:hypothetical protein
MRYRPRNKRPKCKRPKNKLHRRHGYWEVYYPHGDLWFSGPFINGVEFGHHLRNGRGYFDETYNNYYAR